MEFKFYGIVTANRSCAAIDRLLNRIYTIIEIRDREKVHVDIVVSLMVRSVGLHVLANDKSHF